MRPRIERVERIAAPGDGVVERLARLLKLSLIFIKFTQLFIICRGRVVDNNRFNFLNARTPPESLKHAAKQSEVWQHFRKDVNARSQEAAEKNNVEPIVLRPAPHEVQDRQALQDETPRIEDVAQTKHERPPANRIACLHGPVKRNLKPGFSGVTASTIKLNRSLFQVCREPIQKRFVPELTVLRFQHPVALVGKNYQLRGHSLTLQRAEKFQGLRVRHAVIAFASDHQSGRLEFS